MTNTTFTFENPAEITLSAEDIASGADTVDADSVYEYCLAYYGYNMSNAQCAEVMVEVERLR